MGFFISSQDGFSEPTATFTDTGFLTNTAPLYTITSSASLTSAEELSSTLPQMPFSDSLTLVLATTPGQDFDTIFPIDNYNVFNPALAVMTVHNPYTVPIHGDAVLARVDQADFDSVAGIKGDLNSVEVLFQDANAYSTVLSSDSLRDAARQQPIDYFPTKKVTWTLNGDQEVEAGVESVVVREVLVQGAPMVEISVQGMVTGVAQSLQGSGFEAGQPFTLTTVFDKRADDKQPDTRVGSYPEALQSFDMAVGSDIRITADTGQTHVVDARREFGIAGGGGNYAQPLVVEIFEPIIYVPGSPPPYYPPYNPPPEVPSAGAGAALLLGLGIAFACSGGGVVGRRRPSAGRSGVSVGGMDMRSAMDMSPHQK